MLFLTLSLLSALSHRMMTSSTAMVFSTTLLSLIFQVTNTIGQADDDSVGGAAASTEPKSAITLPLGVAATVSNGVSDAGVFVLAETALNMHCWGENPVVTAKLQLNGQDRFSEREGTYFDLVQPYQHHTRNPDTGINVYSFALRPEEHQPSGTCNFSRIDNATLQLVVSAAAIGGTQTAKVRVYATNYNVLRVMSGMGRSRLLQLS